MSNYDIYPLGFENEFYGMSEWEARVSFQAEEMLTMGACGKYRRQADLDYKHASDVPFRC